jgi:hypothetical protein
VKDRSGLGPQEAQPRMSVNLLMRVSVVRRAFSCFEVPSQKRWSMILSTWKMGAHHFRARAGGKVVSSHRPVLPACMP